MPSLQPVSATTPADCASMTHDGKAKAAATDVDCCSPHIAALPVSLAGQTVVATVPRLATCDTRLAERCLSPPERPPRS
jgi:hypothetical protein